MCEIISRGRRLDNGEWAEGFYVHLHDGKGHESSRIYTGYAESDCGEFYPDWFDIDPETAGRDTGTTGAGGVKIFEGDIVRITLPITGAKPIVGLSEVYFEGGCFSVNWGGSYRPHHRTRIDSFIPVTTFEVIGNVHDNPELLGGPSEVRHDS